MSTVSERAATRVQRPEEKREVAYYVRAKTGPGKKDWSPVGVAFKRKNGEDGFTVKLNTLPINLQEWDGALVLVPPYAADEGDMPE